MKNIAVGKGGLTIKLDRRRLNHVGGGFDYINLMALLAANNPDITFWCCSKTNFKAGDLTVAEMLFPHKNVRFCPYKVGGKDEVAYYRHYADWIANEGVRIDAGIFDIGIGSRINIPDTVPKITDPSKFAKPATIAFVMSSPTIFAINELSRVNPDFKYVTVHFDPKCNIIQRDLANEPLVSFAQFDYSYDTQRYNPDRGFYDITKTHRYLPLEATAVFGVEPEPLGELESQKSVTFGIAINGMNQTGDAQNRWGVVKAALAVGPEVQVYGKWTEDYVPEADHHILQDPRMKGPVDKAELDEIIKTWKYTVLSPTGKGWVTAKFYECLLAGIVPLLGPDYDTQNHLAGVGALRIKEFTPGAIKEAIDRIESGSRTELLRTLRNRYLGSPFVEGTGLNQVLMETLDPSYSGPLSNEEIRGVWDRIKKELRSTSGFEDLF